MADGAGLEGELVTFDGGSDDGALIDFYDDGGGGDFDGEVVPVVLYEGLFTASEPLGCIEIIDGRDAHEASAPTTGDESHAGVKVAHGECWAGEEVVTRGAACFEGEAVVVGGEGVGIARPDGTS